MMEYLIAPIFKYDSIHLDLVYTCKLFTNQKSLAFVFISVSSSAGTASNVLTWNRGFTMSLVSAIGFQPFLGTLIQLEELTITTIPRKKVTRLF
jgi:hypothetical protein